MMSQRSTQQIELVKRAIGAPEFITPWLDRFYESREFDLLTELLENNLVLSQSRAFLDRCYRRGVVTIDDHGAVRVADFHTRFEIWAIFEGWKDIPDDIRKQMIDWELSYYAKEHQPHIETAFKKGTRDHTHVWPELALLSEAIAIIDRVEHVYQWPCNCRAMVGGCNKPEYVCLRFDNDRQLGWELSKERAKEILTQAHQKGLMQNAELGIDSDGHITGAICNCCSDCCFPQKLASTLEDRTLWPIQRYLANHIESQCSNCGRCIKRCPFKAFSFEKSAQTENASKKKTVRYDSEQCRGCGVCVSTCPDDAIVMETLPHSPISIISKVLRSNS